MRFIVAVLLSLALVLGGLGGAAAKSSKSGSRPYYGGGKHSESPGGSFSGGQGQLAQRCLTLSVVTQPARR